MYDVELLNLNKKYKSVTAVDDVSLNIEKGEFLFLLGPSGCGKTTTLRMIGGMETPTTGTVRIQGEDVNHVPPEKRDTSTVFQNWALFPHKTIRENVGFGLAMRKVAKDIIQTEAEKYLAMVGLEGFGDRFPAQLSGGQKQRVALARALIVKPAVLLLDEPLSALDLKLRNQMRFEIKRIQKKLGITTIFVTHDQTEALAMADRIVVMNKGRIEQIGTPSEVYFKPKTRFISDFIGEMNFIPAKMVQMGNPATVAINKDVHIEIPASDNAEFAGDSDDVVVAVRPEKIFVSREPEVSEEGNILLEALLEEVTFLGQLLRFHVRLGDQSLIVDDFGGVNRAQRYQDADTIYLEINPKDFLLMSGHGKTL